jgi:hypothetical protein
VEYLAHSASFQLTVNNAPSKPGIKHLNAAFLESDQNATLKQLVQRCQPRTSADGSDPGALFASDCARYHIF